MRLNSFCLGSWVFNMAMRVTASHQQIGFMFQLLKSLLAETSRHRLGKSMNLLRLMTLQMSQTSQPHQTPYRHPLNTLSIPCPHQWGVHKDKDKDKDKVIINL